MEFELFSDMYDELKVEFFGFAKENVAWNEHQAVPAEMSFVG